MAIPALPAIVSLASAGLGAFGSIRQGQMTAAGMKARAAMAEEKASGLELQGKQIGATRAEELNMVLSNISAIRSSRNVGLDSPTAMAVENARRRKSQTQVNAEILGVKQNARGYRTDAAAQRSSASNALVSGYIGAATSLASPFALAKNKKKAE